jgi:hypothetical protein
MERVAYWSDKIVEYVLEFKWFLYLMIYFVYVICMYTE